jgi:hypothetical protein
MKCKPTGPGKRHFFETCVDGADIGDLSGFACRFAGAKMPQRARFGDQER